MLHTQNEYQQKSANHISSLTQEQTRESNAIQIPEISLPKGGGAVKGIDEKFTVNAVNGTNSMGVPLPIGGGRGGFSPSLSLNYSSGFGNGIYGLGWSVGIPSIKRKTERALPQYQDEVDSDTFILSGAEDLIPLLVPNDVIGEWEKDIRQTTDFIIKKFRPRIEGLWARIEQWKNKQTGVIHWRTISPSNVTTFYGIDENSRIANPKNKNLQIYEWFISHSFDDKGNLVVYQYKTEDFVGVENTIFEKNRNTDNCTNLYLKKVCYGNKTPYFKEDALPNDADFLFETVFDYGEHDVNHPLPNDSGDWKVRSDAFSNFRAGFDMRTYRRCDRVLLFHKFDELPTNPYLVSALEISYENFPEKEVGERSIEGFTYLKKITQRGYLYNETTQQYNSKTLPPIQYYYQKHEWKTEVEQVTSENTYNAPIGIDFQNYQWIDLYSEGISGILTEKNNAWYYKQNLGNGAFTAATVVAPKPSLTGISDGSLQFQDLEGIGDTYLVNYTTEPKGFYHLTDDEKWQPFQAFQKVLNQNLVNNSNARFLDLNGDGLPDLLISENDIFLWHESKGEKGFGPANMVHKTLDEEQGPKLVFSDLKQSIFLADMSGDGLTDIVRIRNGAICYWANRGYGRFSSKITMANAPTFDHSDTYNPNYIQLADIDGSGTADIVYLGKNDFQVWMNLSGNAWSKQAYPLPSFPPIDNSSNISVLDLLGTGTSCIVWSSPLPNNSSAPLRYINLMNGKKPHLLNRYENNMGKEVTFEYLPSTHFYLEDKKNGTPWATKLPFPVHVVSKVTSEDKIRETIFTNTYSYHHGYYDGKEREFRGFGRVEQLDTEQFNDFKVNDAQNVLEEIHHQAPIKTVTWFHTGAFLSKESLTKAYQKEYYQNEHLQEHPLPASDMPMDLNTQEWCEALRACKSLTLRQEVYAEDGVAESIHPYSTAQSVYDLIMVQPKGTNKYASFLVIPKASLSYHYDRNPADPRITHSLILATNDKGMVTQSASIVYPRVSRPIASSAIPDVVWQEQRKRHIVFSESDLTADIETDDIYRIRTAYESRSYELLGIPIPESQFLTKKDLLTHIQNAVIIPFDDDGDGSLQKRLSSHSRAYFLRNDLNGGLPLGQRESLGLGFKSYQMAFTPGLVSKHYGTRVTDAMLIQAGYEHSEGDSNWWIPSGKTLYAPDASSHFYLPIGGEDALGKQSFVTFDQYDLLPETTTDAIGNTAHVVNDYRTLSPHTMIDPNQNRAAIETDELGMVIKSAIMGKVGLNEGDTLQDPTVRLEYDLFNWMNHQRPNYVHTFAREQHGAANPRWQEAYVYSDGGGSVIMSKVQAEPGVAKQWNIATQQIEEIQTNNRWVGNGRTILNNKGNAIKQYEPYFSATHEYENEAALIEIGLSPLAFYDAVGRNIRTELPNGTFTKVEFDTWYFKSYDTNDTVMDSQWYIDRNSPNPLGVEPTNQEERAAWLAAKHHNTPSVAHTDSLGRTIYSIADYGNGKTTTVRSETDLVGRYSKVFDQLGREVANGNINMAGAAVYGKSAEKGERWIFQDILGRMVRIWDNNLREFRTTYDDLHRPVSAFVAEGGNEILFNHIVYGDLHSNAETLNLKGKVYQTFDQAGGMTINGFDFKGNPIEVERRLTIEYKTTINWQALDGLTDIVAIANVVEPILENESFTGRAEVDALSRPIRVHLPDGTVIVPQYNEANYLDSLQAQIRGQGAFITFLEDQNYDAKGQREYAKYGNGTLTEYFYDPQTFRLTNLLTLQQEGDTETDSLQNLQYTYDPTGNITHIIDHAQQTHYYQNNVVRPEQQFEYDAIYQLIKATGREHAGIGGNTQRNHNDIPFHSGIPHANNATAVRTYQENYFYDDLGNIDHIQHSTSNGIGSWTRRYQYAYQLDPTNTTNRLTATSQQGDANGIFSATYSYDLHGNMIQMPHLQRMDWNFMDQLKEVDLGGGGTAYYVYSGSGQRMRKVIERNGGLRLERIYLGTVEIYREYQGHVQRLERETVHISDDTGRIAQVDTKTLDINNSDLVNPLNISLIRYQYSNHLGSATLETDADGAVISYEEYHPYGTSAYRSSKSGVDFSLKRYRFTGKERDRETGLDYFGARYYANWLGRWTSSDPAGFVDGLNTFKYVLNNPIDRIDPNGTNQVRFGKGLPSTATASERSIAAYRAGWENIDPNDDVYDNGWHLGKVRRVSEEEAENGIAEIQARDSNPSPPPNAARAGSAIINSANQPRTPSGAVAEGSLNLWSGGHIDSKNPDADVGEKRAADAEGHRMRETTHQAATEADVAAAKNRRGGNLNWAEERPIWSEGSRRLAREGALSGRGVRSHGLDIPEVVPSKTIQVQTEIPTVRRYGGAMTGLNTASGIITIYSASQVENDAVRYFGYAAGAAEVGGAFSYGTGLSLLGRSANSARFMSYGTALGRYGGGAGMVVLSGYSLVNNIQNENYMAVPGDAGGVVGGIGVLAGAPQVAAVGISFSVGWSAGMYINENTEIQDTAQSSGEWAQNNMWDNDYFGASVAAGTAVVTSPYYAGKAIGGLAVDAWNWVF